MERTAAYPRMVQFRKTYPKAMEEVLEALRLNGPMGTRNFGGNNLGYWSYRGRKDSAASLYYLWLLGEVIVTDRRGFDRIYDLRERVAPPRFQHTASVQDAEDYFARKAIASLSVMREKRFGPSWQGWTERSVSPVEAA